MKDNTYIMEKLDRAVAELVHPKFKLQKAYNYYNGKRDAEQFRYLEENFGIGNPTSVEFTPLIRKHIDALIGEYLDTPILPKVSCKDKDTISKINHDRDLKVKSELYNYIHQYLNNQVFKYIHNNNISDNYIEQELNKLVEEVNANFVSNYEIAAQNIIEYIIQSRNTDLYTKLKTLLLDLLITGTAFYRVRPSASNTNIDIEVLNPLNTFIDRNPESNYVKDSYRVVIRKWLTKQQILNKYGEELDLEARDELEGMFEGNYDNSYIYVRSYNDAATGAPITGGIEAGMEITPGFPTDYWETYHYRLIPVYEVEWIDIEEDDTLVRYEGTRIGQSIYILTGKSKNIIRTKDNPKYCTLSVNGIYFVNRNDEPYSLVAACMPLQDKYDLITYFKDNIIANSGTTGDWIDLSVLPVSLGDDLTERLQKFIAYKKAGFAPIDTSQDGRVFNNNTTFAGYDDSIKVQTMQAFELALERVENTCSSITGVFRERLNGIQQHDAVSNVKVGLRNSYIITKPYYNQMDLLVRDILIDSLNMGKIVWKNGLTGTLILGDKLQKEFIALPEHFTITDYDIHIISSSDIMKDMQTVQQLAVEFIKAGKLDEDIIIDAISSRSMTELKTKINQALKKRREENNQLIQLQQKLEQSEQLIKQLQTENKTLNNKLEQLNEAKIQIEQQRVKAEIDTNWYKAKTDRDYKRSASEIDAKKVDIEYAQLYDGNPFNNKIRTT